MRDLELLTPDEVADVLRARRALVMGLISRGELKAFRLGARGQWRIRAEDLELFVESQLALSQQGTDEAPRMIRVEPSAIGSTAHRR